MRIAIKYNIKITQKSQQYANEDANIYNRSQH